MNQNEREAVGFASRERMYAELSEEYARHRARLRETSEQHEKRLREVGLNEDADEVRRQRREMSE